MAFLQLSCDRKDVVERFDRRDVHEIDRGLPNMWRWDWLEVEVKLGPDSDSKYSLVEVIRKLEQPGKCYCLVCKKEIKYSSRGLPALRDHCEKTGKNNTNKHMTLMKTMKSNYRIDGSFFSVGSKNNDDIDKDKAGSSSATASSCTGKIFSDLPFSPSQTVASLCVHIQRQLLWLEIRLVKRLQL